MSIVELKVMLTWSEVEGKNEFIFRTRVAIVTTELLSSRWLSLIWNWRKTGCRVVTAEWLQ